MLTPPLLASLHLFRVLFPSWRFFDEVDLAPVLWVRISNNADAFGSEAFGEWTECLRKTGARTWTGLFLNGRENALHACHSLLKQFVLNLEEGDAESSVSLELVENLVLTSLINLKMIPADPKASYFQFKLCIGEEEVFLSRAALIPQ